MIRRLVAAAAVAAALVGAAAAGATLAALTPSDMDFTGVTGPASSGIPFDPVAVATGQQPPRTQGPCGPFTLWAADALRLGMCVPPPR